MSTRELWLAGETTAAEERDLFDAGVISECEFEFGPHDEHDDCERMMGEMRSPSVENDWFSDAFNREAEEESLGRPLFPNEY